MKCLVFALYIAGAYGCGLPTFPPVTTRVVGGEDVRPHSWPWQASVQVMENGGWRHNCGGTLITDQWVLTAAHCMGYHPEYRVALGKHNLKKTEEGEVYMHTANIIMHEKWDKFTIRNDIALIKLASPVTFSDTIMVSCLPDNGIVLPHNQPCFATGWGCLYPVGFSADILQQALLPVVDHAACTKPEWWGSKVTQNMLCAGAEQGISACRGDSGGPLNCQNIDGAWVVHGITSFGTRGKPDVFTRVSNYIDWINTKTVAY